jgi:alpha-beta hydrolase superfamily lysophospholipase
MTKEKLVVIIPGNPGDPHFYRTFVELLKTDYETVIWDHRKSALRSNIMLPYAYHQMDKVLTHLKETGRTTDDVEICIVAHSVGCYLTHLIVSKNLLPIHKVVFMCPYIMQTQDVVAKSLLKACSAKATHKALTKSIQRVPRALASKAMGLSGIRDHHKSYILDRIYSQEAMNYGVMASDEHTEIQKLDSCEHLLQDGIFKDPTKFLALYAEKDRWANREGFWTLGACAKKVPNVTHEFVLDNDQNVSMFKPVKDFLDQT